MPQKLSRRAGAILLCFIGASSAGAAPPVPHNGDIGSLAQPAKAQCHTIEVCTHWHRNPPPHYPTCDQWSQKKVCEPWVYNNPNMPPPSPPNVHVPKLIAKPKPWQFQLQPTRTPPPSFARSPSMMHR